MTWYSRALQRAYSDELRGINMQLAHQHAIHSIIFCTLLFPFNFANIVFASGATKNFPFASSCIKGIGEDMMAQMWSDSATHTHCTVQSLHLNVHSSAQQCCVCALYSRVLVDMQCAQCGDKCMCCIPWERVHMTWQAVRAHDSSSGVAEQRNSKKNKMKLTFISICDGTFTRA